MKMILAAVATLLASAPAIATVTTTDYSFSAIFDDGPHATLDGTFSIAADDVAGTNTLTALDFSVGDKVYDLTNTGFGNAGADMFILAGLAGGLYSFNLGMEDFNLSFFLYRPAPPILYYSDGSGKYYDTANVSLSQSGPGPYFVQSDAPEPATWGLMVLGFGAVGAGLRRRRTKAAVLA